MHAAPMLSCSSVYMVIYRDLVAVGHTTSPKYLVILQLEVIYDDVSLFPSNPWDPLYISMNG